MAHDTSLLDQRLAAFRDAGGVPREHVERLAQVLRASDYWACYRLNPLAFAAAHGLREAEAIDLFLHASRVGLLELRFNTICPGCGGVEYQHARMDALPSGEWYCVVCHRSIEANLDDRIEVSFTPELGVRRLDLDPYRSTEEYFRTFFSPNHQRSAELQAFVNTLILRADLFAPGQERTIEFDAKAGGEYRLLSLDKHSEVLFDVVAGGPRQLDCVATENGLSPARVTIGPGVVRVRLANRGNVALGVLTTAMDFPRLEEIIRQSPSMMRPFLTAKMLLNSQTFRDLFRVQTLDPELRLRLRSITLLFTDLKGSTELYDRTGDIRAYSFVREHFRVLSDAVKRNRGAIIKTMGDAIMASFNEPTDAARAAVEMMAGMDALNDGMKKEGHDTGLKVGLHEGPALAVTSEERLDYFGQTVNVAARVQGLAAAGEIWLTPNVHDAPGVRPVLDGGGWRGEAHEVSLKGVGGKTRVHRLAR